LEPVSGPISASLEGASIEGRTATTSDYYGKRYEKQLSPLTVYRWMICLFFALLSRLVILSW